MTTALATAFETTASTRWEIDPAHTLVELSVRHMMLTKVKGRFRTVGGAIQIDAEDPTRSSVDVTIAADSIDTGVAARDEHLRSEDFLAVASFPELRFRSRRVQDPFRQPGDAFLLVGDLTIRGVTREVVLDVTYEGRIAGMEGGEIASFSATTRIDRRDFGLTWNQALETGGVLVGNQVDIALEVQAVLA